MSFFDTVFGFDFEIGITHNRRVADLRSNRRIINDETCGFKGG